MEGVSMTPLRQWLAEQVEEAGLIKTRSYGLSTYEKCFAGSDFVTWFVCIDDSAQFISENLVSLACWETQVLLHTLCQVMMRVFI